MSRTIAANIRGKDKLGRWGGEEFLAVIKTDQIDVLKRIANKLRLLVSKSSLKLDNGKEIKVTVSIGGTIFKANESITELVKRADEYMYESKENGRNKVTIK